MGKTTELRREIKQVFVPYVERLGFVADRRYAPQFLEFRRVRADRLEVFDIQWEKYGSRRFVVNFGSCPASGVVFGDTHIAATEIGAAHCSLRGRLQPGKGAALANWFNQDKPWLLRLVSRQPTYPAQVVVARLLELFAELEAYWDAGSIGPHLRLHPPPRRAGAATPP